MPNARQIAIVVHAALKRAGYQPAATPDAAGYIVSDNTRVSSPSAEVEVSHMPITDDPYGHALMYYSALAKDATLTGLAIQFSAQPYPRVLIRG